MTETLAGRSEDATDMARARVGVTAIFFANGFGIGAWAVAIPQVKALFGLSDATLSLTLFAIGAGAIASMPIAGLLPPRLGGTGPTLRVTGPIYALLLAALPLVHGLSSSVVPLMVTAVLFGVFNILMDVPMNAHASIVERRQGHAIMSSFHAAWSGGGLIGSAFGGYLISRGATVSAQLGVEAAIIAVIAFAASFVIGPGETRPAGIVFAAPERRLLALCAIAFLAVFAEASVNDWSALYLNLEIGLTPAVAAAGFSAYALMMFLGRAVGDRIVRARGRTFVIVFGAAAIVVGASIAVGVASPIAAVGGFCIIGLGVANMVPAVFSASAAAASSPSLGIAMAASLAYTASLIGPPIFGAVASMSSLRVAFAMLLPAALAIIALAVSRRQ
jgi:MFS family permease